MSSDQNPHSQAHPTIEQGSQNSHEPTQNAHQTLPTPLFSLNQNSLAQPENTNLQLNVSAATHTPQIQYHSQTFSIRPYKKKVDVIDLDDDQIEPNEKLPNHQLGTLQNHQPTQEIHKKTHNQNKNQIVSTSQLPIEVQDGEICPNKETTQKNNQNINNVIQNTLINVNIPHTQPHINLQPPHQTLLTTISHQNQSLTHQNIIPQQQSHQNHQTNSNSHPHIHSHLQQTPKFQNITNPTQLLNISQITQQQHQTPVFPQSHLCITNNIIIVPDIPFQNTQMIDQNQNHNKITIIQQFSNSKQMQKQQKNENNVINNTNTVIMMNSSDVVENINENIKQSMVEENQIEKQIEKCNIEQDNGVSIVQNVGNNKQINQNIVVSNQKINQVQQKVINHQQNRQNIQQIVQNSINNINQHKIGQQIPQISSQNQQKQSKQPQNIERQQQNIQVERSNQNPQSLNIPSSQPIHQNYPIINLLQQQQGQEEQVNQNQNPHSSQALNNQLKQKQKEAPKPVQIQQQKQVSKQVVTEKIDINRIKSQLVQYLPSPLRQQALALADDALIQLYMEIRGQQQKNAANNSTQNVSQVARVQATHPQQKPMHHHQQQNNDKSKLTQQNEQNNVSKSHKEKEQSKKQSKKSVAHHERPQQTKDRHINQSVTNNKKSPQTNKKPASVKRERKRVVTTVVQQIEYFDDSETEQPSKYAIIDNGQAKRKANVSKAQMQETLTQLSTLVHSLDLTAFANQNT